VTGGLRSCLFIPVEANIKNNVYLEEEDTEDLPAVFRNQGTFFIYNSSHK
jgi:hypothetical protein